MRVLDIASNLEQYKTHQWWLCSSAVWLCYERLFLCASAEDNVPNCPGFARIELHNVHNNSVGELGFGGDEFQ
jgi:hypothetical protein